MSDETAALTATLKAGGGYDAPWLVVRADDPQTLVQRLDAVAQQAVLAKVAATAVELHGVYNAAAGLGAKPVQVVGSEQQPPWGGTPQQAGPTSPAPSAPAPQATGAPGPAPVCAHGQRQFVQSKPGAAKQWKGWFCPQPKNATDKCAPEWIKD